MKKIVLLFSALLFVVLSMGQNTDISHMSSLNQVRFPVGTPPGPAGPITGPITVCRIVSNAEVYSIDPIVGATNYVWSVPPGAQVTGGTGTVSITVNYPAGSSTGFVSVYGTNDFGAGAPSFLNVTVLGPTLVGPTSVCKGSTGNTYTTEAGKTAYVWVVSFGGTKTGGGNGFNFITITWTSAGNRSVKVTYTDGTCTTFVILPVIVYPVQPGIFGPASLCAGIDGTFSTETGMLNYIWTTSPSGTITGGATTNTVTANWTGAGPQTISCVYTNPAGCTALTPTDFTVLIKPLPTPTITASSGLTPCVSTGNIYTTEAGMTDYIWTISTGGGIVDGGNGFDFINVTWNSPGPQTVSVNYTSPDGCTAASPTIYNLTVIPSPVPTISGPDAICGVPSAGNLYTTEPGMTGYSWAFSPGGSLDGGGGLFDDFIIITWTTLGPQTVSVNYTDPVTTCPGVTATIKNIVVNPLPAPTILGTTSFCGVPSVGNIYVTEAGQSNYVWDVSPGGTKTLGGGLFDDFIIITWTAPGPQSVSVNYENGFGCFALTSTVLPVIVNPVLPVSVTIAADVNPVCAGSLVTFTATPFNGGITPSYQWFNGINPVGGNSPVFSYTPGNGDAISVVLTSSEACQTGSPATSNTVIMTVNPILSVSVSIAPDANPVCDGTLVTFTATPFNGGLTPSYQWYNGINPVGGNSATYAYVPVDGDAISVVLTSSETCQSGSPAISNTVIMIVNPLLPVSVSITASANPVCAGTSVTFTATPTNGGTTPFYQWKVNGVNAGPDNPVYTFTPVNGDVVTCVLTSDATCISGNPATSNPIGMIVNPLLPVSVSITASANPVCTGDAVTFTAIPVNGGTTPFYQWMVNGINAGPDNPVYTFTPINGDVITCMLTSNAICPSGNPATSNPVTMTVNPLLPVSVTITASANPVCAGTGVTFTAFPINGGTTPFYQWKVNGVNAGPNLPVYTFPPVNGDVITCVLTSNATCPIGNPATSNPVTMTVNPLLPVSVTIAASSNPVCAGTAVTFTATPVNGGTTPFYQWKVNGVNTGPNNPVFIYTPINSDVITCVLTSNATCPTGNPATSNPITMTVNPLLPVSVTIAASANPVCAGTAVTFTATPVNGGTTPFYQWMVNGVNAGTNNPVYTFTPVNGNVVTCVLTSNATCPSGNPATSNPITMTVNPLPVPSLNGPSPVCLGSTGNVYTTEGGMSNYSWTVIGGTPTAGGTSTSSTVTVTWTTLGTQSVSVNYANAGGCTAINPTVKTVTVNPSPIPTITGYTSMCVNIGPLNYVTEPGMTGYFWTVSPGNILYGGQGTNLIQIEWTVAGSQWVEVTYTSPSGCGPVAPTHLDVFVEPLPDPAGTITGDSAVCGGTNGVSYSIGAVGNATSYVWSLPNGASIATGAGTNSITVDFGPFASSGNITVYGNNVCGNGTSSPPFAVNVTPLPDTAGIITGQSAVCQGVSGVIYTVPAIANAASYFWTVPSGAAIVAGSTTNSITVDFSLTAVSGTITVYGINSCGNGALGPAFAVTVNPIPPTPIITQINDTTLHSNIPNGNLWYFEGSPAPPPNTGQDYITTQSGHYWCVVTLNGCSSDTSNHIEIVMIGIPTIPSTAVFNVYPVPNDGRFTVSITYPTLETFTIQVYNTLGVKISELRNVEVNGTTERTIDLRPTPAGIYSVVIENSNKHVIRKILINR